jgi:RHS repeat-associated protein
MDGQRLVNTNSFYGNSSAKYQTENDIITRVTPNGTAGNGPAWFSAQTKSGLIYEYGNTLGSKQLLNGFDQVVNWYLSKISDLFGNQITFDYLQDNGSVYPAQMIYGPNKIIFYYKERTDKSYSYIKGVKIEQRLILDKIKITYNNTILKTYEFKYNSKGDNYNTNSILNEVIEYGIGTSRLNSTAFTYQLPDNVTFSQALYNTTQSDINYNSKLYFGDFTGDGKADALCLPNAANGATWTGWKLYKGIGNESFSLVSTGDFSSISESSIDRLNVIDLNGDNKDDLVFHNVITGNYYYAINNGDSFGSEVFIKHSEGTILFYFRDQSKSGDVNGDGFNDIIIVDPNGEINIFSYDYVNGIIYPVSLKSTLNLGYSINPLNQIFLADFNGDGIPDIWIIRANGIKIYTLQPTWHELYSSTSIDDDHKFIPGDYNGDGKTDMFLYGYESNDWTNWQIRFSTGTVFETIYIPQKKANLKNDIVRSGDFNGDGCTDLMITAGSDDSWTGHYYYISKNKGTDFHSYVYSAGQVFSHNYYINDFNGDGRDEYLCTDGLSPWWTGYMIYSAPGKTNILLEKAGNGLGNLTTLAYTKLSQASSSVYQRGTGAAFPVSDYQGPLTVVTSATFDNGIGSTNSQNYYYEGMKIHRQGKGLLGYAKTQVTDAASGIIAENTSTYNTTYFSPSITTSSKKLSGQPTAFETVTNTWSQRVLDAAKKRIFPYVQTSVQSNSLTQQSDTVKTTIGDDYGNATSIVKSYNNNVTETTTNTYNNNSTLWLLGRPITTSVQYSGGGSTITRSVNRVFGTSNNSVQSQTALPGNSLQVVHGYKYNANGTLQRDSVTASGACRKNSYTYDTYGIKMLTQMDALSHVSTNTYDTYGRFSQKQDYLGNTETYQFDNLSRQTSATRSDGSSTTTVYSWESPTTSFRTRYSIQITGNDGSVSKVWYDLLGREIRSDVKSFNGTFVYTSKQYNNKGQVSQVSESYFPSETAVWNVFSYDSYGRKTGVTTPSGRNSTWSYSGSTVIETTAGKTFTKTYASDGTMTSATDNGNTISYTYFPDGKVKTITAPGGIVTSMLYDLAGNQTQLTDPSAGVINYTYNGFGELTNQQNARSQNIQLTYLTDGRLQQKVTPEGTTTYSYNTNKQLTGISSPESISRSYSYDTKGRVTNTTETIAGSAYSTTFTYDNLGRPSTTSHPSGITETNNYNNYGYLASVSAGGSSRWTTLAMNNRGQITSGRYGASLTSTMNYNSYGYPTTVVTGSLRSYEYEFNPVTGNLNWRKNVLQSNIQENFEFDNLDRLDRIYRGSTTLLDMAYDANKGGITTKSDAGTFKYDFSLKPYALSDVDPSEGLIPEVPDSLTYTSFESIKTITEDEYHAAFVYNSDNERAKMDVQQNGTTILTRIYPTGNYLKETAGGVTKEYTFIGGDAYSAPCVAIKQQGGTTRFYYILRDHLGSITHVIDTTNTKLYEYSYDAWGRLRNDTTWEPYAPGSEPALFIAGRGYTGHEHLPWFSLINMNGRVYDPLTGQFLSADNFNQAPDKLMGFNRYAYAHNNPLIYTDPSGEKLKWWQWGLLDVLTGGFISATVPAMVSTEVAVTFTTAYTLYFINSFFDPQRSINTGDIWGGLFQTDPNLSTEDRILQFASRFTWEGIQTDAGYNFAQIRNLFGGVDNVEYFGGSTLVNRNTNDGGQAGMTLGNYILGTNLRASIDDWTFMHEYGHTLQSRVWGPYYTIPALLSGADMLFNGMEEWEDNPDYNKHDIRWYETGANSLASDYFEKYYGVEWDDVENPRSKDIARSLKLEK